MLLECLLEKTLVDYVLYIHIQNGHKIILPVGRKILLGAMVTVEVGEGVIVTVGG